PGLVGGHCIGVDPYYLTYKASALGYHPQVILSGRTINDGMAAYIAKNLVQKLAILGKNLAECKVLIFGTTFKENVADIRNSKVPDIAKELIDFGIKVELTDTHASPEEFEQEYQHCLYQQRNLVTNAVEVSTYVISHFIQLHWFLHNIATCTQSLRQMWKSTCLPIVVATRILND
ncbi:MAG: hypothetical protein EAZ58_12700, partial [Flavobacterium sp.]